MEAAPNLMALALGANSFTIAASFSSSRGGAAAEAEAGAWPADDDAEAGSAVDARCGSGAPPLEEEGEERADGGGGGAGAGALVQRGSWRLWSEKHVSFSHNCILPRNCAFSVAFTAFFRPPFAPSADAFALVTAC